MKTGLSALLLYVLFTPWPVLAGGELYRIPLSIENRFPIIEASIAGKNLSLMLDLADYLALSLRDEDLARVPVEWKGTSRGYMDAAGNVYETRKFIAKDVQFGDLRLPLLHGARLIVPDDKKQWITHGHAGFALLKDYVTVFDYRGLEMRLYTESSHPALAANCGGNWFPLRTDEGFPRANAAVMLGAKREPVSVVWDTGATHNFLHPSLLKANGLTMATGDSYELAGLSIAGGGYRALSTIVYPYQEPKTELMLGHDFFQAHVVCFDLPGQRAAVKPYDA